MSEQDYVAVISLDDLKFRHDIIEATHVAVAATRIVLESMCYKDKAATVAYYHRLLDKCRDLDSKLELDTNKDLASQPAWTKYCKECLNLVVLRKILYDGQFNWTQFTGLELEKEMDVSRQTLRKEHDLQQTCVIPVTAVVGRPRTIERTAQQLLNGLDYFCETMHGQPSTKEVVAQYYQLMTYCREADKLVDDSWENRPSRFKDWEQFCSACHIGLLFYSALHGRTLNLSSIPSDEVSNDLVNDSGLADKDATHHTLPPVATLAQRSPEAPEPLPSTAIDNLKLCDEGGSSTTNSNNVTGADAASPHEPYLCLVRDKLVFVKDEGSMGLAGKDDKQWQPQAPNILVCQLQPDSKIILEASCLFPDHELDIAITTQILVTHVDVAFKQLASINRDKLADLAEGYWEQLSAMDFDQLMCQYDIGIASAEEKIREYKGIFILVLWLRQFLYGIPIPILLPEEEASEYNPIFRKHGIPVNEAH